jgi:SAM-dependent methyltransferase
LRPGAPPLAYHRARPDADFWSAHWESQSLEHLLEVARTSELTRFLERYVHAGDRLLEAGCGLGQYVRYFAERGVRAAGVDFSERAVERHREVFGDSDVRVADLSALPFADRSFDVYVSLGVIEHYAEGAGAILAEARRMLDDGGLMLLSTPYLNLARRVLRPALERRQREIARRGGAFYQYAFDERTLDALLGDAGFTVTARSYYDPGRGLRELRGLRARQADARGPAARPRAPKRHGGLERAILYARPTLKALAHMQIVCARKTSP